MKIIRNLIFLLLCSPLIAFCTTFNVTNTNDGGSGSLREAITIANATSGVHIIAFNIPNTDQGYNATQGVWYINPATPLPYITRNGLTIDGTTQTANQGNTNASGPEIMLQGNNNAVDYCFFIANAADITIRGFIVSDFTNGIQIYGNQSYENLIAGNFVGTTFNGMDTLGNYIGIEVFAGAYGNIIGGTDHDDRNIISGNEHIGLRLLNSSGNWVKGNFVGTNRTGSAAVRNYDGISIEGLTTNNLIGGTETGARNIVSGNVAYGIPIFGAGTDSNLIIGNYIGLDSTGSYAIPNTYGVLFDDGSAYNIVGGYNPDERNLISGNSAYGIFIYNMGTNHNQVIGNYIGTDKTGVAGVGNGNGIVIDGAAVSHLIVNNVISANIQNGIAIHITGSDYHVIKNNFIGTKADGISQLGNMMDGINIGEGPEHNQIGDNYGGGNVIAWNGNNGVAILGENDDFNTISGNSIFNNYGLGIDLYPPGVTVNDSGDADIGPNDNMNFPLITSVTWLAGNTIISGNLDTPDPEFSSVEIFLSANDPQGYGEGKTWLSTVVPDPAGNWADTIAGLAATDYLTCTATDSSGNTSEFSASRNSFGWAGFDKNITGSGVNIFPIPAIDKITIELSGDCDGNYSEIGISDLCGRTVISSGFSGCRKIINTSDLPAGIFLITIRTSSFTSTEKLIISH